MALVRRAASGLALAVAFLTIVPVRVEGEIADLRDAAGWFALVGALIGGVAAAVRALTEPLFGPGVGSILAVTALIVVTGGLHQDGLADCADGLGARGDRARRLAVMRDPAIGVFGALALIVWALLLSSALSSLTNREAAGALIAACALGRWAVLAHATLAAPARPDGLGAAFSASTAALVAASVTALVVAVLATAIGRGLAGAAAAATAAAIVTIWARRGLGGRTGDTLGATVALAELATVLTLLALALR